MPEMRKAIHYILFLSTILFFMCIFAWAANNIIKEREIEKLLDDHGVSTVGIIVSCHPGQKSTPVEFEYEVVDELGNKTKYTTTNHGGGETSSKCKKGQTISARYLPESPDIARHSRNINYSTNILIAVCSLAIAIGLLYKGLKEGVTPRKPA